MVISNCLKAFDSFKFPLLFCRMKLNGRDKKLLVGESLGVLSDETIAEIFEQLAPRERARFSAINKRLYNLLHPVGCYPLMLIYLPQMASNSFSHET